MMQLAETIGLPVFLPYIVRKTGKPGEGLPDMIENRTV